MGRRKKTTISYGTKSNVNVLRVIDGDTFKCNIPNWSPIVGQDISIRIRGVNAHELRGKDPVLKHLAIREAENLRVLLACADNVELRDIKRGKYFRLAADVFVDGKSVAFELQKCRKVPLNVIS